MMSAADTHRCCQCCCCLLAALDGQAYLRTAAGLASAQTTVLQGQTRPSNNINHLAFPCGTALSPSDFPWSRSRRRTGLHRPTVSQVEAARSNSLSLALTCSPFAHRRGGRATGARHAAGGGLHTCAYSALCIYTARASSWRESLRERHELWARGTETARAVRQAGQGQTTTGFAQQESFTKCCDIRCRIHLADLAGELRRIIPPSGTGHGANVSQPQRLYP